MPGRAGVWQRITPTLHPSTSYGFPSILVLVLWQVFSKAPWQQALLLSWDGRRDAGGSPWLSQASHRLARLDVEYSRLVAT